MFRGLYTAANAMITDTSRIDALSNNLANASTGGFKKDVLVTESFPEKLLLKINGTRPNARADQTITVRAPALLEGAQNQAPAGPVSLSLTRGYLSLENEQGTGYYKSARLMRDAQGYLRTVYRQAQNAQPGPEGLRGDPLVTKFGAYLLDESGARVQVPAGRIGMTPQGGLQVNGQTIAQIVRHEDKNVVGTINGGHGVSRTLTNFSQGTLEETGNELDAAIQGPGFFKVATAQGTRYTRHGSFQVTAQGLLADKAGALVLTPAGEPLRVGTQAGLRIDAKGLVYRQEGQALAPIGQIALVQINNVEDMRKTGDTYFTFPETRDAQEAPFAGVLLPKMLEGSNVQMVQEMVEMISLLRGYESSQKVIRAYDDIMNKASNEIGKV